MSQRGSDALRRIERDVEDLILRVRAIENASSPYAQQLIREFEDLKKKVADFTEQGTPPSRREIRFLEREIGEISKRLDNKADVDDVARLTQESLDNRRLVRSALVTATLSVIGALILFFIERNFPK